jgi:hypothetical protein
MQGTAKSLFFGPGPGTTWQFPKDMTYDVIEHAAVNEDQAERIYQKWQHHKK